MAAKRKQGTLSQVGDTVGNAARSAIKAADEYLVEPVGNFLGLTGKTTQARKRPAGKKTQRKRPARPSARAAKRPSKRTAKPAAKRAARPAVKAKPSGRSRRSPSTRAAKRKRR